MKTLLSILSIFCLSFTAFAIETGDVVEMFQSKKDGKTYSLNAKCTEAGLGYCREYQFFTSKKVGSKTIKSNVGGPIRERELSVLEKNMKSVLSGKVRFRKVYQGTARSAHAIRFGLNDSSDYKPILITFGVIGIILFPIPETVAAPITGTINAIKALGLASAKSKVSKKMRELKGTRDTKSAKSIIHRRFEALLATIEMFDGNEIGKPADSIGTNSSPRQSLPEPTHYDATQTSVQVNPQ